MKRHAVPNHICPLTKATFKAALRELQNADPNIKRVITQFGPPPMWSRKPAFATLMLIILEQQVSLASARATFDRLKKTLPRFAPVEFLKLKDETLRKIGFSRQKTRYGRILAQAIHDGTLSLKNLAVADDSAAREMLTAITGIGPWTADIYLLMALKRPDIWPRGDLALDTAVRRVIKRNKGMSSAAIASYSKRWKPWRSVAARVFWHYYLNS